MTSSPLGETRSSLQRRCSACGEDCPLQFVFCGSCGAALDELAPATPTGGTAGRGTPQPTRPVPKRTLVTGALLLVVGLTAAIATFSVIQTQGSVSTAQTFGGPVVNWLLGLVGIEGIEAPEGADGASGALIGGFVIGCVLTALGVCLLLSAGAVALYRSRHHASAVIGRAQPAVQHTRQRTSEAIESAKPTVVRVGRRSRARLSQAAQQGGEVWRTAAAPRLADATDAGRRGWESTKPKAEATARAAGQHVRGLLRRRHPQGGRPADFQPALPAGPTPPGWYPDPGGGVTLRYWDGLQWTAAVIDPTETDAPSIATRPPDY